MSNCIVGKTAKIVISEPEDFYFENGGDAFTATILSESSGSLILRISRRLTYQGKFVIYMVASVRHVTDSFDSFEAKKKFFANFIPVLSDEENETIDDSDILSIVSNWRRGHLVGELTII